MRIKLLIGPEAMTLVPFEQALGGAQGALLQRGVLYRGDDGGLAARLISGETSDLAHEIARHRPKLLILSSAALGASLCDPAVRDALRAALAGISYEVEVIAFLDAQARAMVRQYGSEVMNGRAAPLDREIGLCAQADWWEAAGRADGSSQAKEKPAFWLDYRALQRFWQGGFGAITLRGFTHDGLKQELAALLEFAPTPAMVAALLGAVPAAPSAATLARARQLNGLLGQLVQRRGRDLPAEVWRGILTDIAIDGPPMDPGSLSALSDRFAADNAALIDAHPHLAEALSPPSPAPNWHEADPGFGFRASQYLLAFMWRIDRAMRMAKRAAPKAEAPDPAVQPRSHLPPLAAEKFAGLVKSPFRPHNRLGRVDEETPAPPYAPAPPRELAQGSTGRVIVGCMKNEAPYILEWVAYHRAIGVDNFLIYTNGCKDGTDEILYRLQEMGVLQHRLNDNWKGNSPQQYALNQSLKEPLIRDAEWIIHIDVDEFINVRCGNGTLDDFFARAPEATNVAMTWRLFGHNGVTGLNDDFVVDQFDRAAPKFCPKPHTVWGFKTMFRNIGAYAKISCHRPNKLNDAHRDRVKWVNGSGQDMTAEARDNGWRNSKKSIGYDLIQLNHYALRSAESFLIKRQRGRALHVDRSIGLNYWIRMDWCDFRDLTIKRNLPRLRAEYDRLLEDDQLRHWHEKGRAWHRAKAAELRAQPEFRDLYEQAIGIRLTETERAAYALALDMQS